MFRFCVDCCCCCFSFPFDCFSPPPPLFRIATYACWLSIGELVDLGSMCCSFARLWEGRQQPGPGPAAPQQVRVAWFSVSVYVCVCVCVSVFLRIDKWWLIVARHQPTKNQQSKAKVVVVCCLLLELFVCVVLSASAPCKERKWQRGGGTGA